MCWRRKPLIEYRHLEQSFDLSPHSKANVWRSCVDRPNEACTCSGIHAIIHQHCKTHTVDHNLLDRDGFRFDVIHQASTTTFTPNTGLLGSAERHICAENLCCVDIYVASIKVLSNAQSSWNRCCEDAGCREVSYICREERSKPLT